MDDHYWESVWNDKGQYICKTCSLLPKHCQGKIVMGKLNHG